MEHPRCEQWRGIIINVSSSPAGRPAGRPPARSGREALARVGAAKLGPVGGGANKEKETETPSPVQGQLVRLASLSFGCTLARVCLVRCVQEDNFHPLPLAQLGSLLLSQVRSAGGASAVR